ncbi:pentatricopeptide repeat-containing protein At4g02750-like [Selaginella moellendorffii]|nr:pentatricopeptide repeat-containing protein At4g02750-like [Selaginella moellendorffii]|eukprot:XP_024531846.1 pentatricopeptide repeat-containing protein At4g02750-like [Selaginella moellendorffii]
MVAAFAEAHELFEASLDIISIVARPDCSLPPFVSLTYPAEHLLLEHPRRVLRPERNVPRGTGSLQGDGEKSDLHRRLHPLQRPGDMHETFGRGIRENGPRRPFGTWELYLGDCDDMALDTYWKMRLQGLEPDAFTVIAAYTLYGHDKDAFSLFHWTPDIYTFSSILGACASPLEDGRMLHQQHTGEGDPRYLHHLQQAKSVFDRMPEWNTISWNSMLAGLGSNGEVAGRLNCEPEESSEMIAAYTRHGSFSRALSLIKRMDLEAWKTLASPSRRALVVGIAGQSTSTTRGSSPASVSSAAEIFSQYRAWEWSLVLCTTMVAGFARNGHGRRAHELFELTESQGLELDVVSFTTILAACSAAGLLHDGRGYFVSMRGDYALAATMDHYVCVIDLLARSGRVD